MLWCTLAVKHRVHMDPVVQGPLAAVVKHRRHKLRSKLAPGDMAAQFTATHSGSSVRCVAEASVTVTRDGHSSQTC